jgi:hypothetical protein
VETAILKEADHRSHGVIFHAGYGEVFLKCHGTLFFRKTLKLSTGHTPPHAEAVPKLSLVPGKS